MTVLRTLLPDLPCIILARPTLVSIDRIYRQSVRKQQTVVE